MLNIILETINTLKICLLIALFIGLLFGYLYTKLKAYELYSPNIKKFKKNINNHTQRLKEIDSERKNIKEKIEEYENKLKSINQSISEYKERFKSRKNLQIELMSDIRELNAKFKEKKNILKHYSNEIERVKKECRLDDVANISKSRDNLDKLIKEKKTLLDEENEKFSLIQRKIKDLDADNNELENKFDELNKKSEKIKLNIIEKESKLKSLEKGFIKEYGVLYKDISLSHDRIKELRGKLLKLKES